jgi:hypothetical protein
MLFPISSTSATRPRGLIDFTMSSVCGTLLHFPSNIGVLTQLGQTQLTQMPLDPRSTASRLLLLHERIYNDVMEKVLPKVFVTLRAACFEVAYAIFPGITPYDIAEVTLTNTPRLSSLEIPCSVVKVRGSCLSMTLTTAFDTRTMPFVLIAITRSESSISLSGPGV